MGGTLANLSADDHGLKVPPSLLARVFDGMLDRVSCGPQRPSLSKTSRIPMKQPRYLSDEIDRYRIKSAESEADRVKVLEGALEKAMERARMSYLWITLSIAVFLVTMVQASRSAGFEWVSDEGFRWSLATMTVLIVLPWQLRKLRVLG